MFPACSGRPPCRWAASRVLLTGRRTPALSRSLMHWPGREESQRRRRPGNRALSDPHTSAPNSIPPQGIPPGRCVTTEYAREPSPAASKKRTTPRSADHHLGRAESESEVIGLPPWILRRSGRRGNGLLRSRAGIAVSPPGRNSLWSWCKTSTEFSGRAVGDEAGNPRATATRVGTEVQDRCPDLPPSPVRRQLHHSFP